EPAFHLKRDTAGAAVLDASNSFTLDEPALPCINPTMTYGTNQKCQPPLVQHPIVDLIPGKSGYTGLWEVVKVKVPRGYSVDSVKSFQTVKAAGYKLEYPGVVINCPIIDVDAAVQPGVSVPRAPFGRLRTWYRTQYADCEIVEGSAEAVLAFGFPAAMPDFSFL